MQALAPSRIDVDSKTATLNIVWNDDHSSAFAFHYLRSFCPCANCQGHGGSDWHCVPDIAADIGFDNIEEMGHYALSISWNDQHSTGIYSWDILRQLCPCAACQEQVGKKHAMHLYRT